MKKISKDNIYANKLAEAGYKNVTTNFTAKQTAEKINELYKEILT